MKKEQIKFITLIQEKLKNIKPTRVKPRKKLDYVKEPQEKTVNEIIAHAKKNRCPIKYDPETGTKKIIVPEKIENSSPFKNIQFCKVIRDPNDGSIVNILLEEDEDSVS